MDVSSLGYLSHNFADFCIPEERTNTIKPTLFNFCFTKASVLVRNRIDKINLFKKIFRIVQMLFTESSPL